jgi:hypothetical protein
MAFSLVAEVCYAEFRLCWVLYVLSVPNKPFLVGVIRLNDVMLGVIMLSLVAPITYRNNYSY